MKTSSFTDPSSLEISVHVEEDKTATVETRPFSPPSLSTPTLKSVLSRVDDQSTLNILIAVAAGMRHLHEHGYAHMSLNAESIMINKDNEFSIVGLDNAKRIPNQSSADAKADVFAFAGIMNDLFNKGTTPISNVSKVPHKYSHLFNLCASKTAGMRPQFSKILEELQSLDINSATYKSQQKNNKTVYRPNLRMTTDFSKFEGVIPAFYACYNDNGDVDRLATKKLTRYLIDAGVKGLYVGGSSGECIYQNVEERKKVLEAVQEENNHEITIIAHVACNNLYESQELARHAESLEVDAIASIPPVYFHLPEYSIAEYWNGISEAAPHTPFIIYNIPQLAGVALTSSLLAMMLENPNVIGVKNSSTATQDIQMWRDQGDGRLIIFNGPDEQLVSGLVIGAGGCIGGTYAAYPELVIAAFNAVKDGDNERARDIQNTMCEIIYKMGEASGNLYSVLKEIIRLQTNGEVDCGGVRAPLSNFDEETDRAVINEAKEMIDQAYITYGINK